MNPLDGLDEISIENLQANPPRITRDVMHKAAQRARAWTQFRVEDVGRCPTRFSSPTEMLIADELNDMLRAARAGGDIGDRAARESD